MVDQDSTAPSMPSQPKISLGGLQHPLHRVIKPTCYSYAYHHPRVLATPQNHFPEG
jgi:hypothetical protein